MLKLKSTKRVYTLRNGLEIKPASEANRNHGRFIGNGFHFESAFVNGNNFFCQRKPDAVALY